MQVCVYFIGGGGLRQKEVKTVICLVHAVCGRRMKGIQELII